MQTFLLSGTYSQDALKGISTKRTRQAIEIVEQLGGTVSSMYVVLGERDLMLIVELPNISEAIKASVELNKTTGISFTTAPLLPVEEFDLLMNN